MCLLRYEDGGGSRAPAGPLPTQSGRHTSDHVGVWIVDTSSPLWKITVLTSVRWIRFHQKVTLCCPVAFHPCAVQFWFSSRQPLKNSTWWKHMESNVEGRGVRVGRGRGAWHASTQLLSRRKSFHLGIPRAARCGTKPHTSTQGWGTNVIDFSSCWTVPIGDSFGYCKAKYYCTTNQHKTKLLFVVYAVSLLRDAPLPVTLN